MSAMASRTTHARSAGQNGLTLIELMIAMVLGLIVVGGAVSVIIANGQTYRTNEAFSQIQESSRTVFELLARDIRQSAASACGNTTRIANVLNTAGGNWWQNWLGIRGYDGGVLAAGVWVDAVESPAVTTGSGVSQRVAGTDAILLQGAEDAGLSIKLHTVTAGAAKVEIDSAVSGFVAGDILMACDFDHAAIFQASSYDAATVTIAYDDAGSNPGNCSEGLGFPEDCSSTEGNIDPFELNSQIARMTASTWYIGNNGRADEGGRSLYRVRLGPGGVLVTEEVVAGVTNMQLLYREGANAALVAVPGNWNNVNAVEITLTMDSADRNVSADSSVNAGRLRRSFTTMVGIRSRSE